MMRIVLGCLLLGLICGACGGKKEAEQEPADEEAQDEVAEAEEGEAGEGEAEEGEAEEGEAEEGEAEEGEADEGEAEEGEAEEGEAEGEGPPEVIELEDEDGTKDAVIFPHEKHAELDEKINEKGCETCHHEPKGEEKNPACDVEGCHDGETEGVPSSKDAHHTLCKDGCHKKQLKANPDNEALKKVKGCSGCHSGKGEKE
jgi:hypothetical protein